MYKITMINRNGYTMERTMKTIEACKNFFNWFPPSFFAWIYDVRNDEMKFQSQYTGKLIKCNNENFVPYWC